MGTKFVFLAWWRVPQHLQQMTETRKVERANIERTEAFFFSAEVGILMLWLQESVSTNDKGLYCQASSWNMWANGMVHMMKFTGGEHGSTVQVLLWHLEVINGTLQNLVDWWHAHTCEMLCLNLLKKTVLFNLIFSFFSFVYPRSHIPTFLNCYCTCML